MNFLVYTVSPVQNLVRIGKLIAFDRVLFVERSGELLLQARLRSKRLEPKGNRVLNSIESVRVDPKPGDLSMSRLKPP